jgi:hypothetical protein
MTMISHAGAAGSLFGTFHEAAVEFVQTWMSSYERRLSLIRAEAELRSIDPRILADLGVEYGPTMLHSQAEAVVAAASAFNASRKSHR